MRDALEAFLPQIPDLSTKTSADLIGYFVYFLTVIGGKSSARPADVDECFTLARLPKYSNVSAYLSRRSAKTRGKPAPRFLKSTLGYQLERNAQLELQKTLHSGPARIETSHVMRRLLPKLTTPQEQAFLQEAIDCYEIGARRAAIVMTWLLTVNHLYSYVLKHKLTDFNVALAKNTDKRIKLTAVSTIDDFSEIPEGKFIEFCRSGKVISNDVRKILDAKLGIRNTSAHPSAVTVSDVKTTDFIIDLVDNVILKYAV